MKKDTQGAAKLASALATMIDNQMKDDHVGLKEVLTLRELAKYTGGLRRSAVAALMKKGQFPHPVKLSERRRVWLKSEIISWQLGRIAAARKPAKRVHLSK
jgi:prophage regulatory protein